MIDSRDPATLVAHVRDPNVCADDLHRALADVIDVLLIALRKIDRIRNNIVGSQSINWSRDIYPLVSALKDAGYEGEGSEAAKARLDADPNHGYQANAWAK
jgi:hypothetical protein